ncbi:MAG: hypothetical protein ACXVA9_11895 [Bdellovibrionales bacterium]
MHLLDPRAGILPIATCLFIGGTILFSWIQAARQQTTPTKSEREEDETPQSKSA